MSKIKVIFMGTTDFGVPALEKLVSAKFDVVAVICQPDRPNKRGKKIEILPLKKKAVELGISVLQPENIKDPVIVEQLKSYQADIFVVAAYGQILSKEILTIPPYGAINIHGSLLPEYRGAAPIQRAIIDGKTKTGVTIMQMSEGMDTGEMLAKAECSITETTTFGNLYEELAILGGNLLIDTLTNHLSGEIKPEPQNDSLATYAEKILKDTGAINWSRNSQEILSLINGTDPIPGAYTFYQGNKIKIFLPKVINCDRNEKPGTILIANDREGLIIKTKDAAIKIGSLQFPGKTRMDAKVFLRGKKMEVGTILN